MRTRTSTITGTMAALLLAVVCMSAASAIAPAQVAYSPTELWAPGRILTYKLEFHNRYTQGGDDPDPEYRPTVVVDANVNYNITAVSGDAISITETISGLTVNYPFAVNDSHRPYIAIYNQSVNKADFLRDFVQEVHAFKASTFGVANHSVRNIPINATGSTGNLELFENKVIYYKNNNSVVPQVVGTPIVNRFIVSSNITGVINSTGYNIDGNTSTDKIYAHALFYTPMSFAGQHGTFWLNAGLDLASVSGMGLWTVSLLAPSDNSTFPMGFDESDTYTWHEGQGDEAFRWRAKFGVGYPKVGGNEQAKFDSQTGILLEYYTEQSRADAYVGTTFYQGLRPHYLKCELKTVVGIAFGANATPEVPGFPVITLLVAIGIGVALVYRKYRK